MVDTVRVYGLIKPSCVPWLYRICIYIQAESIDQESKINLL